MKTKTGLILLHLSGCLVFLALPVLFSPDLSGPRQLISVPPFQRDFLGYVLLAGFFYLNYFFLVPKLYFRKRYLVFVISCLFSYAAVCIIPFLIIPEWHPPFHEDGPHHPPHMGPPFLMSAGRQLLPFLMVLVFSLMIRIINLWKQAERQKLQAEISYLKAQINPHFLFNTLNSIYSLSIAKSSDTPGAVIKLSDMMRYVLSDAEKNTVPLQKEISYIQSYVDLQQIRFGDAVDLHFTITGDPLGKNIAPLLLIPFVENAYKYGVNAEENSRIQIDINITDEQLTLEVFNHKVHVRNVEEKGSGLGIANTRKRLNLLYPVNHELMITDHRNYFSVRLKIRFR